MNSMHQISAQLRQFGLDPRDWLLNPRPIETQDQMISLELVHREEKEFKLYGTMADGELFALEVA